MEDEQFFTEVRRFLDRWRTASLATVDELGLAHAANVQFVPGKDLQLFFISSPDSAHSRHLARDPRVAMTVYAHLDDSAGPGEIRGLQLHGRCSMVTDPASREAALQLYLQRFTFIAENEALATRVMDEQFYVVQLTWLRWIDNRRGFGFKEERTIVT